MITGQNENPTGFNQSTQETRGEKGQANTELCDAAFSTKDASRRGRSELLQELSEVGGLGELPGDPGQLVEDRTVQGHARYLPLCTGAAVTTDLQQLVLLALPLTHVLMQGDGHAVGLGAAAGTHSQLGEVVTHRAVQRGEVVGDGPLPPHLLPC